MIRQSEALLVGCDIHRCAWSRLGGSLLQGWVPSYKGTLPAELLLCRPFHRWGSLVTWRHVCTAGGPGVQCRRGR